MTTAPAAPADLAEQLTQAHAAEAAAHEDLAALEDQLQWALAAHLDGSDAAQHLDAAIEAAREVLALWAAIRAALGAAQRHLEAAEADLDAARVLTLRVGLLQQPVTGVAAGPVGAARQRPQ